MEKSFSKGIAIFCLLIYVLFGFANSGNMGVCFGSEHNSHFGIIISGYETCCHQHSACGEQSISCDCNDVDIDSTSVSQSFNNNLDYTQTLECVAFISTQIVFSYIGKCDIKTVDNACGSKSPPIKTNTDIIKSVILLI